jgi:hypothetical protein
MRVLLGFSADWSLQQDDAGVGNQWRRADQAAVACGRMRYSGRSLDYARSEISIDNRMSDEE